MTLSLRAAASLPAPPLGPPRGRRTASVFRATASPPPALHNRNRPRPQNVSCEFFVDCATYRWMAPEVFNRIDGMSAVAAQPSSDETRTKALQALLSCLTVSIHTNKPAEDILQVQNTFPLAINDDLSHHVGNEGHQCCWKL